MLCARLRRDRPERGLHDLAANRVGSAGDGARHDPRASATRSRPPGSSTSCRRRGAPTSTTGSARWISSPGSCSSRPDRGPSLASSARPRSPANARVRDPALRRVRRRRVGHAEPSRGPERVQPPDAARAQVALARAAHQRRRPVRRAHGRRGEGVLRRHRPPGDDGRLGRAPTTSGAGARRRGRRRRAPWHFDDPGENIGPKSNDLWKPVIAAVNGMACGGAFYILGEVDFVIAAEHATFFDPHVTFGMTSCFESMHMLQKMPFHEIMRARAPRLERADVGAAGARDRARVRGRAARRSPRRRRHGPRARSRRHRRSRSRERCAALWTARELSRMQALDMGKILIRVGSDRELAVRGSAALRERRAQEAADQVRSPGERGALTGGAATAA